MDGGTKPSALNWALSLTGIFGLASTKARLLESYGEFGFHQPCIRSSTTDHDSFFELRLLRPAEAGRSIKRSMDFRPPLTHSGYPACEPAALDWSSVRVT